MFGDDDITRRMFDEMDAIFKQLGFNVMRPGMRQKREHHLDVIDRDDEYIVIVELQGVENYEISININWDVRKLMIVTTNPKNYYSVPIFLPEDLEHKYKRHFNNGILELVFKKL